MRILITNDDGIFAPGIVPLVKWASRLGEVVVVAPKTEQSGKSHAIEFVKPVEIKRVTPFGEDIEAYAMDSTPADCVRFGICGLKREYDLVLSGINRGVNLGVDMIYSGTVAAIFEAAYWNHRALAFSTYPDNTKAYEELDNIYRFITENSLFDVNPVYNVNIPNLPSRGIRITTQGSPYFDDGFVNVGGDMYLQTGNKIPDSEPENLLRDTVATAAGYVSLTPLTLSRTNLTAFNTLRHLNK